ncbi:MAG: glycine/sarcosine/betaine reductase selenoprotein B family protein [Actinomycetota bacterium]
MSDLHQSEQEHLRSRAAAMPAIECGPWRTAPPLDEATVAIVSTAGLHRRDDPPFRPGAIDYRILPGDLDFADIVLSHVSTNFDRSAIGQDPNVAFPLDRLRDMAAAGEIGAVAPWHYSFMGAQPDPGRMEATGAEVGELLAADGVDVALLVPV